MFTKIFSLVSYHLGNFDDLIQSGFWVPRKITFFNLCKAIHDVLIIPVLSDPLNLESGEGKKKVIKKWISREQKGYSGWNIKHFS